MDVPKGVRKIDAELKGRPVRFIGAYHSKHTKTLNFTREITIAEE